MEAQRTNILLNGGRIVEGLLNWKVIYRLENTGKFNDILANFMKVYQFGLSKERQYMDMITVLYVAYLGANYESGDYMEFESFLEAIPFSNPALMSIPYANLFNKKKQDSETFSTET